MEIINIVKNTKELYPKYVTIVKLGSFYYCYGRDCYIMAYLLRYKIYILKDKYGVSICLLINVAIRNVLLEEIEEKVG